MKNCFLEDYMKNFKMLMLAILAVGVAYAQKDIAKEPLKEHLLIRTRQQARQCSSETVTNLFNAAEKFDLTINDVKGILGNLEAFETWDRSKYCSEVADEIFTRAGKGLTIDEIRSILGSHDAFETCNRDKYCSEVADEIELINSALAVTIASKNCGEKPFAILGDYTEERELFLSLLNE